MGRGGAGRSSGSGCRPRPPPRPSSASGERRPRPQSQMSTPPSNVGTPGPREPPQYSTTLPWHRLHVSALSGLARIPDAQVPCASKHPSRSSQHIEVGPWARQLNVTQSNLWPASCQTHLCSSLNGDRHCSAPSPGHTPTALAEGSAPTAAIPEGTALAHRVEERISFTMARGAGIQRAGSGLVSPHR